MLRCFPLYPGSFCYTKDTLVFQLHYTDLWATELIAVYMRWYGNIMIGLNCTEFQSNIHVLFTFRARPLVSIIYAFRNIC